MKYLPRKLFEEQLKFVLSDGTEVEDVVRVGNAEFLPLEILTEFDIYEQEYYSWLDDWRLQQAALREEILDYSPNRDRYFDLKDAFNRQQVVPFVGSGMSVPSGKPTWSDFLRGIGKFASSEISAVDQLVRESSFEEAADLIASLINTRLFAERIEHDLRLTDKAAIDGPVALLPELFTNLVVTTNLDDVLEGVYEICDMSFGPVINGTNLGNYRQLKGPKEKILLKLHGDCKSQIGRVLLTKEYDSAYTPGSIVREELTLICQQHNLLFLGCSLGKDRTVRLIEEVASKDDNMPKHYAFLEKIYAEADRIQRENFLTSRGIYPIWYDLPHDDAIMALLDGLQD